MGRIIIYGAPGAGKTSSSKLLHKHTGIMLYEGDYLREVIAVGKETEQQNPFLHIGTKQAWRKFGSLTTENVIKGMMATRAAMRPYVDKELVKHNEIIFEAAFVDPRLYADAKLFLVVTLDEDQHHEQFFKYRDQSSEMIEGFQATRVIQNYLIKEAAGITNATIIENKGSMGNLLHQFDLT